MSHHLRLLNKKSPEPLRTYARDTIDAVRPDLRQGVLVWRMADLILEAIHERDGQPVLELAHAPQWEQHFAIRLAQALFQATVAIDGDSPPTPDEIRAHEQRKQAGLSKAVAQLQALDLGHRLDTFRPGELGYEVARCQRCGSGVSLHLATGQVFGGRTLSEKCLGGIA